MFKGRNAIAGCPPPCNGSGTLPRSSPAPGRPASTLPRFHAAPRRNSPCRPKTVHSKAQMSHFHHKTALMPAKPQSWLANEKLAGRKHCHLPSTTSIPARTRSVFARDSLPARSVSSDLSSATTCDTFATDSFGRPVRRVSRRTFPGASAHFKLLVSGTHRTVAILLRLNESPCTTTTGRRNRGPEPRGFAGSAHQISPWEITIQPASAFGRKPAGRTLLQAVHFPRSHGPTLRSTHQEKSGHPLCQNR